MPVVFILILCIVTAQSIVFQDMQGEVFIIDDTMRPPKGTPALEDVDDVLTLIDADGASCQPDQYLLSDYKHRILLTSSSRPKVAYSNSSGLDAVFVMEPWSRVETVVALFVYFA